MKIAVIILTYQNILYTNHHSSDVTTWGYDGIHPAGLPSPNPHWAAQTPTQTQDVHQMPRTGSYASSRFGWVNWSTGPVEHLDHKMFIFSWISNFQVPSSNTMSVDWWMVCISTQMCCPIAQLTAKVVSMLGLVMILGHQLSSSFLDLSVLICECVALVSMNPKASWRGSCMARLIVSNLMMVESWFALKHAHGCLRGKHNPGRIADQWIINGYQWIHLIDKKPLNLWNLKSFFSPWGLCFQMINSRGLLQL